MHFLRCTMYPKMLKISFENILVTCFQGCHTEKHQLEEAHSNHTHIFDYSPNSAGALAYKELVKEVTSR